MTHAPTAITLNIAPSLALVVTRHETDAGLSFSADLRYEDQSLRSLAFTVFDLPAVRIREGSMVRGYLDVWFGHTCMELLESQAAAIAEFLGIPMPAKDAET